MATFVTWLWVFFLVNFTCRYRINDQCGEVLSEYNDLSLVRQQIVDGNLHKKKIEVF